MDYRQKSRLLEVAQSRGACNVGLRWLLHWDGVSPVPHSYAAWAASCLDDVLPQEFVDAIVHAAPEAAAARLGARLNQEQVEHIVANAPRHAAAYLSSSLNKDQIARVIKYEPECALKYLRHRLTSKQAVALTAVVAAMKAASDMSAAVAEMFEETAAD